MESLGENVKVLLTYDIVPEAAEEYYKFTLGKMVPAMEKMGLTMVEAWHTAIGNYPIRLIAFVAEDWAVAHRALDSDEFHTLEEQLMRYVSDYERRVVPLRNRFQF